MKLLFTAITLGLLVLAGRRYVPSGVEVPWTGFAVALLFATLSILSMGFLIASLVPTARFAQPIATVILYPMSAVSGLFAPLDRLPPCAGDRRARAAADVCRVATPGDLARRDVGGAHGRRCCPDRHVRTLHGPLGEGLSLGMRTRAGGAAWQVWGESGVRLVGGRRAL